MWLNACMNVQFAYYTYNTTLHIYSVVKIPGEWQNVGTQLGIGPNQLDGIKKDISYGGDPKEFFRAVLEKWEANQTRFNWCTMLSILSSSSINEEKLARKIASQLQDKTAKGKNISLLAVSESKIKITLISN